MQEHGLARDVTQEYPRRHDHEIGFAKCEQPLVVHQPQREAGRGFGHRHDRPHALSDGERRSAMLLHDVLEDAV